MIHNLITLQTELLTGVSAIPADSIAAKNVGKISQDVAELKSMSLAELLNRLADSAVNFAINLAIAIVVFYVGRFIIRKIYRLISAIFLRRKLDRSLSTFVLSLSNIVMYFILIVTVIGILGIETTSFLALFASAGVAIGMALSGTLQNFAGGVLILLLKPYKIGDYIEAQGYAGTVKEIQIFFTVITTYDNKSISIPNGVLSTSSINNWTRETYRRVSWTISISYGDDVARTRSAILEMLAADERIVRQEMLRQNPPTEDAIDALTHTPDYSTKVIVKEMASSSVDLEVRAWTETSNYWPVFYEYNERFYSELPKHGVHFPFPQLDVHFDKV